MLRPSARTCCSGTPSFFPPGDLFSSRHRTRTGPRRASRPSRARVRGMQPAAELSYSPTKMEKQSVADKSKNGLSPAARPVRAARHVAAFALAALIALPHGALAQDWSVNARLLAAARAGDESGLVRA